MSPSRHPIFGLLSLLLLCAAAGPALGSGPPGSGPPGSGLPGSGLEPVRWLQEYLQIDTTNPPGNERPAAEFLASILEREGLTPRLLESPGGRTSLYARLAAPGSGGRAIAVMHHLDVVPAGTGWRYDPFSGRPAEGKLWGRGALDVKGLGIAHLTALLSLAREGATLGRDVIYLAVADEETGGGEGAAWLWRDHPELFDGVEAVLGEGGSNRVLGDRLIWWGIEVTQKRPLWLRVTAHGRGGHASGFQPASATHQLVTALGKVIARPLRYRVTDAARSYFEALAKLEGDGDTFYHHLDEVIREDGPTIDLAPGLPVYFVDTLQVTELTNARGGNVISPRASARIDSRLLPDTDLDAYLRDLETLLGERLEVEVLLSAPPAPASPVGHPVYRALERALAVRGPAVPTFIAGVTDSRYFRQRGIPAYGFSPFALEPGDQRGIHAVDESIPRAAFLRGIETMRRVLRACAGG